MFSQCSEVTDLQPPTHTLHVNMVKSSVIQEQQGTMQKGVGGWGWEQALVPLLQCHLPCPDEFKDEYQSQSFAKGNHYRLPEVSWF